MSKIITWLVYERRGYVEAMNKDYYLKKYGQQWLDDLLRTARILGEVKAARGETALRKVLREQWNIKELNNEEDNLG